MRRASELPTEQRAALFVEVSKLLTGAEKEFALSAAFALRQAEAHQLKLTALLAQSK